MNLGNPNYYSKNNCLIEKQSGTLMVGFKNSVIPLDDDITSIYTYAFWNCVGLKEVMIPASVTTIEPSTFAGCSGLIQMEVQEGNPRYHSQNNCIIETAKKTLIAGCQTSVIPTDNSVTSISDSAFEEITSLTHITVPDNITSIGNYAFFLCTGLKTVTLPQNLSYLGMAAFSDCYALETVNLPETLCMILESTFAYCHSLHSITIPSRVNQIQGWAFHECHNLKNLVIPKGVTEIGDWAFTGCANMESITMESGNANYYTVNNCLIRKEDKTMIVGCKNSVIPADGSVTTLGPAVFLNTADFTSLSLPVAVTKISDWAFGETSDCFTHIYYAGSQEQWQQIEMGYYNQALKQATLFCNTSTPFTATLVTESDISQAVITGIDPAIALGSVSLPRMVAIDGQAVEVTALGENALANQQQIQSLYIPATIKTLQAGALAGCTSLATICYGGTQDQWNQMDIKENNAVLSSATIQYESYKPVEIPLGNLNGDTNIDAKDALLVLKIAVKKIEPDPLQAQAADVNKDGNQDAKDALEILKFAVRKPSVLDQYYNR